MIQLTVNGRQVELDGPTPLLDYVASLGVDWRAIAVELNGEIIERERYGGTVLKAGDRVEIVRMVGGGLSRPSCLCTRHPANRELGSLPPPPPARPRARRRPL